MHTMRISVLVATATHAPTGAVDAYLITDSSGTLLVDPAARTDRFDDLVAHEDVDHLAVTHTHANRIGAIAACTRETGATVWCHRSREHTFSVATEVDPDRTFTEGTTVSVSTGVEVLDTPGHAHDHVGFVAGDDVLCSGLAVAEGSVVVDAPESDVRAYLAALGRLHARGPERLRPGHGPEITDPWTTLARLVAHRNGRERAVLDAMRTGNATPDAVTDAAHDKDMSVARDLARATAVAYVEKLAAKRRVRWDPEAERAGPR